MSAAGGGCRCPRPREGDRGCSGGSCGRGVGARSPQLAALCPQAAAMEEGMSSMQQKATELEHMAEVLLTGEQLR